MLANLEAIAYHDVLRAISAGVPPEPHDQTIVFPATAGQALMPAGALNFQI